jgi:hypothetical protein
MPALFPRWSNVAARGSLLAIIAVAGGIPAALMVGVRTSFATGEGRSVPQPIPFDHSLHSGSLHIDCRYCHSTVESTASAGIPPTAACVGCHNPVWLNGPVLAPVRASLSDKRPIQWQRVNRLPDFVFFNHSIHVAKGVGCESCHGRVDQMKRVVQTTPMSMAWCVGCHRDPTPNLRPRSAITTMGWFASHSRQQTDSAGALLMQAYHVRRLTNCTTCHR